MNNLDLEYSKNFLSVLIDSHLINITRAAQMPCFQLSNKVSNEKPNLQLHIQCSFRIIDNENIIVASADIYQPNSSYELTEDFNFDDFNWDLSGENRFDEIIKGLIIPDIGAFEVKEIQLNLYGDLKIEFKNGYILEVYIDTAGEEECWRFFDRNKPDTHLVVTGRGISD